MTNKRILVWLEWPEECFRVDAKALRSLRAAVGAGGTVRRVTTEAAFLRELPRATHAIVWEFRKDWFARARNLQVLATPAAGRELVAWRDAPARVRVHFGTFHGAIIAESVVAFCLAWARGFFAVKPPLWPRSRFGRVCYEVQGTKAVIAGYGRIGRAVGAKLAALGVEVQGFTRANAALLPRAAKDADWFILALPGDTGTDDFLDARLIARLPRRCVVVNVGRGNAVDEAALRRALESGRLAGAYLDVFKGEPTALNTGDAPRRGLWEGCRNLVAMPHSAAFSPRYIERCFRELTDEGLV